MKRGIIKAAAAAAIALGTVAATAGSASANADWSAQFGPTGSGCFAWTTYGNGYVTGHAYSQSGDDCWVEVTQWYNGNLGASNIATTAASGNPASTRAYYYGGPEIDRVCAADLTHPEWGEYCSGVYSG